MRWAFKYRKELDTGQYHDLVQRGFIKEEDLEPPIEGFEFYNDAFRELSTSRPSGLDIASIPFTAIVDYFRIYGIGELDEFAYVIRRMDDAFIALNRAVNDKPKGDKNGGHSGSTNKNKGGRARG